MPEDQRRVRNASGPWVRTSEPLLWLGGAGHERVGPEYFYDTRLRSDAPHVCLQLTLSGRGFHESGRTRTILSAGMAFLDVIPGRFKYGHAGGRNEPYELIYVALSGPVAMRWFRRLSGRFGRTMALPAVGYREGALAASTSLRSNAPPLSTKNTQSDRPDGAVRPASPVCARSPGSSHGRRRG